jgi:hypothetical protein
MLCASSVRVSRIVALHRCEPWKSIRHKKWPNGRLGQLESENEAARNCTPAGTFEGDFECYGLFTAVELRQCAPHSSWAKLAGVMRQIDRPSPNLFQSDLPRFGSKDWVPTNYRQRVVAFVFGLTFVMGSVIAIASAVLLKTQLSADLHSEAAALFFSFFLVCLVLVGGVIVIVLGVRFLKGAFRTTAKSL